MGSRERMSDQKPLPKPSRSFTTPLIRRSLAPKAGRYSSQAKLQRGMSTLSHYASGSRDGAGLEDHFFTSILYSLHRE